MISYELSDVHFQIVDKILEKLNGIIEKLGGNIKKFSRGERAYAIVFIPEACDHSFRKAFLSTLSEFVLFNAKTEYFDKFFGSIKNELKFFALKKALIFSEFEFVRDKLMDRMKGYDKFYIDGIKNFLLAGEKQAWREIIKIASSNKGRFAADDNHFNEFFTCVTSTITSMYVKLSIIDEKLPNGDDVPKLVDELDQSINYSFAGLEKLSSEELLISNILEHYPETLQIFSNNLSKDCTFVLDMLFFEKT